MIVISDTSPITNLIQIDCLDLLNAVFGKIIIPQTVYNELCGLPDQKKIIDNQDWISVVAAENRTTITQLETQLDKGEAELKNQRVTHKSKIPPRRFSTFGEVRAVKQYFAKHYIPNSCLSPKKGWLYTRFPVALYSAFATAPKIGGNGGSPIPVGLISFFTKCTSIALGASLMRIMR